MSYLLDTHYILWSLFEPDRIGKKVKRILVDEEQTKYVSGISIWEISLKYSIGKLELIDTNPDEIIEKVCRSNLPTELVHTDITNVTGHSATTHYKCATFVGK